MTGASRPIRAENEIPGQITPKWVAGGSVRCHSTQRGSPPVGSQWEGNVSGRSPEAEALLTPSEVAALFRVDPKTVTRWAKAGKLTSIRTLGGHRRYRAAEVYALLETQGPGATTAAEG